VVRLNQRTVAIGLAVLLCGALGAHCYYYWPFLSDDALISLRYAERFAMGRGLTWTDGERVEGYSDLLWVLLTGLGAFVRLDVVKFARFLDALGGAAAILAVGISPTSLDWSSPRLISGGTLLALSAPLAVWAIGGLEHGFMAGVLAVGLLYLFRVMQRKRPTSRELLLVGLPFAALALLRIDGAALLAGTLPGLFFVKRPWRERVRRISLLAAPTAAALAAQEVFRLVYYGQWVPNTALVKVSFNPHRVRLGFEHVQAGYRPLWVLVALAIFAAVVAVAVHRPARERIAVPIGLAVIWTAYVALVGGDIFPGWRQLSLALIPLAYLVAEGAERVAERWGIRSAWGLLAILGLGYWHWTRQLDDPENKRAKAEVWEWDGYAVGDVLKRAFGARAPLLAVDAAGALPYWSGLPALDMLGLNDAYLPRHPPPGFGELRIGHDLGDGDYVMRRNPDLIAFNGSTGYRDPLFVSGRQMVARHDFRERYHLVRLEGRIGTRAVGEIYFKRDGGPVGIQRTSDRWEIPGYLLDVDPGVPPAHLDGDDRLVLDLFEHYPLELRELMVPAGAWVVSADPPDPEIRFGLRCPRGSALKRHAGAVPSISLEEPTPLTVTVGLSRPDAPPVALHGIALERVPPGTATYRCVPGNATLRASPGDLETVGHENADWRAPQNLIFGWEGVAVAFPEPKHPKSLELSVDNNDSYLVKGLRSGQVVWQGEISPRQNGGGMAVHRFELPEDLPQSGIDSLEVRATTGDGRFSLGHLRLDER
jgi:arabinofuranosyltransferase